MDETKPAEREREDEETRRAFFLEFQQGEVDGAVLFKRMAEYVPDKRNRDVLLQIAREEAEHARFFESCTKTPLKPGRLKVAFYLFLNKVFGYTFTIKLFERAEEKTQARYIEFPWETTRMSEILEDERHHEKLLASMLDEERIRYTGNIVLGMNDALIELTGALSGYTLAMRDTALIAMAGIITGFSATLSMAASSYLSAHAEGRKDALKSSVYTGLAYLMTVFLLIFPCLLAPRNAWMTALVATLCMAVTVIAAFNAYSSVVFGHSFRKGFLGMSCLSLGVAAICFVTGLLVKEVLGIEL